MASNRTQLSTNPVTYLGKGSFMVLSLTGMVIVPNLIKLNCTSAHVALLMYTILAVAMIVINARGKDRDDATNTGLYFSGLVAGVTGCFMGLATLMM